MVIGRNPAKNGAKTLTIRQPAEEEQKMSEEEKKLSHWTTWVMGLGIAALLVGGLIGFSIGITIGYTDGKKDCAKPAQTEPAKATPQNAPETAMPAAEKEPEVTYKVEGKTRGNQFSIDYKKYTSRSMETLATFTRSYSYNGEIENSDLFYYNQSDNRVVIWLDINNKIESVVINWGTEYVCNRECDKHQEKAYCDAAKKVCDKAQEKVAYWLPILDWPTRCANYKPPTPLEQME